MLGILVAALAFQSPSPLARPSQSLARPRSVQPACSAAGVAPLLAACTTAGQVGLDATEDEQAAVTAAAEALQGQGAKSPARVPLAGTYDLLYSASKGGSSGKLGPLTGKVTQIITDDTNFINRVEIGPLRVSLSAERKVLDDERIRVSFVETAFCLFGVELLRKPTKGAGVWQQVYVEDGGADGSASLRVMNTPSLFVLKQR